MRDLPWRRHPGEGCLRRIAGRQRCRSRARGAASLPNLRRAMRFLEEVEQKLKEGKARLRENVFAHRPAGWPVLRPTVRPADAQKHRRQGAALRLSPQPRAYHGPIAPIKTLSRHPVILSSRNPLIPSSLMPYPPSLLPAQRIADNCNCPEPNCLTLSGPLVE